MIKRAITFNVIEFISMLSLPVVLSGCSNKYSDDIYVMQTSSSSYTPCHIKHAKRGYNKPYTIKGIRYTPQPHYEISEIGIASYYGGTDVFHGRPTSTGKIFDKDRISAAHKTAALPCVIWVTNLENGRRIKVEVNDRGPFIDGRVIDVSRKTAQLLGFYQKGTAKVHIETALPETLMLAHGELHDDVIQMADVSYHTNLDILQNVANPTDALTSDSSAPGVSDATETTMRHPRFEDASNIYPTSTKPSTLLAASKKPQQKVLPTKNFEEIILQASKDDDAFNLAKPVSSHENKKHGTQGSLSLDSLIHQVVNDENTYKNHSRTQIAKSIAASTQIEKSSQLLQAQEVQRSFKKDLTPTTIPKAVKTHPDILSGHQGYFVQAASLNSKQKAQTIYEKLQKIFAPNAVRRDSIKLGATKTHRILVGPLRSRQDAKILLQKVTSAGIKTATVIYNG